MLTIVTDDLMRGQFAREIMDRILPALDAEYNRIREEEGMTRDEFDKKTMRIRQSIRVRISQIKKELQTARGKRKADLEKMLQLKQAEYDNFNAS